MIKCFFENNNQAQLRHAVADVIAVNNNQILMVRRSPQMTRPGKLTIPGGYVDFNETIEMAALRELREETGYEGKSPQLFAICDNPQRLNDDRQNVAFFYIIEVGEKVAEPDHESSAVLWFDLDNLPEPDEYAFDHYAHLQRYRQYLKNPAAFKLPFFVSSDHL